jgi:hypothetical protein
LKAAAYWIPRLGVGEDGRVVLQYFIVIASAAKQSIYPSVEAWIASLRSQ